MLAALKAQGLKARRTRQGDPPEDRGHLQVDMPIKGRNRFVAIATQAASGALAWRLVWDRNDSVAGLRRRRRAEATEDYRRLMETLRDGRLGIQTDLFC